MSLLMWGFVYQGYNAVFPSFYPEPFPTRNRVTAMAIAQNVGTTITALLPALFATVAGPGSAELRPDAGREPGRWEHAESAGVNKASRYPFSTFQNTGAGPRNWPVILLRHAPAGIYWPSGMYGTKAKHSS
jgi:hypothetical protein